MIWRPVDWLADWMRHAVGVQAQLRMGVLMSVAGLAYMASTIVTKEPKNIYFMSAAALFFAGIGVVITAETLAEVATDVDEVPEETAAKVCQHCGEPSGAD